MADKRRFELFAQFIVTHFAAPRIYDVAGGMGRLNAELTRLGRQVTTFDCRHKRLDVTYSTQEFNLETPCACDLVVGLHPDGATRPIVEYAAHHRLPFAIVPCCADNGMSYKPWMRFLAAFAEERGMVVERHDLPMDGRSTVIVGRPRPVLANPDAV